MKTLCLLVLSLMCLLFTCKAQIESIVLTDRYKINDITYIEYSAFNRISYFKDQSLINFNSPQLALASYYCNTSKEIHEKYVSGIPYDPYRYKYYQGLDTVSNFMKSIFSIEFAYNKKNYHILRYAFFINSASKLEPAYMRFVEEFNREKGNKTYYLEMNKDDAFLQIITYLFGVSKKSFWEVLFNIKEPKNKDEKEFINLILNYEKALDISKLIELYKNKDKSLELFFDL